MHPFPVGRKDARPATVRDQRGMSRSRRSRHYRIRSESVRCAPSGGWSVRAGRGARLGMLGLDAKATPIAESVVPSIWARSVSWGDLGAENLRSETVRAQKPD